MKAIDLFCGIGGFHYAAKANGIDVVFASEIDKYAVSEYEANHGLRPHGDITKIEAADIPPHDILMGGFPCQPFSLAGQMLGTADTRGTLFHEILRIVEHHRPRFVLLENVAHFEHHDDGRTLQTILGALQQLGYHVKYKVLNSVHFGVPQSRRRIYIVAFREPGDYHRFSYPLPRPITIELADVLETDVSTVYHVSVNIKAYFQTKKRQGELRFSPRIANTLVATYYKSGGGTMIVEKYDPPLDSKEREFVKVCSLTDTIRMLTPRECARLQGFPEAHKIGVSRTQAYKQFGNAVTVPVAQAILEQVVALTEPPTV